jgi:hypothetical protein
MREAAARVDLVLLDGGINDINVRTILNPFAFDSDLRRDIQLFCGPGVMGRLLADTLQTFPNARIIVTGDYPLVTERSDSLAANLLMVALGVISPIVATVPGALLTVALRARILERSRIFLETSDRVLADTVRAAGPRVSFVESGFGPEHAFGAPQSRLWGLGFPVEPLDPLAAGRRAVCAGDPICAIASMAHPNVEGARAYVDAISLRLPAF